jgi:hypothetical protein
VELLANPSSHSFDCTINEGVFFEALRQTSLKYGSSIERRLVDVPCQVGKSKKKGSQTAERKKAMLDAIKEEEEKMSFKSTELLLPMNEIVFKGGYSSGLGDFSQAAKSALQDQAGLPDAFFYLRPDTCNHPVIDACIYPNILINFKVAEGDSINEDILERHLECLPEQDLYYFDYVVPETVYSTFKPPHLTRDSKNPLTCRVRVRVVKVVSKLSRPPPMLMHGKSSHWPAPMKWGIRP